MRAKVAVGWFLLPLLAFGAPGRSQPAAEPQALAAFAQQSGLHDVAGFVDAVQSLRATRHLPQRYVTKREAAAHGWHGGGLCTIWPGHVIGGDPFDNAAGALPGPARSYHEADLDESCARRGPKRLIYSEDGAIYITVDHYSTIVVVP